MRGSSVTDVGPKVEICLAICFDYIVPVALPSPLAVTCDAPDGLSLEMSI